jgi:hypothetical protein
MPEQQRLNLNDIVHKLFKERQDVDIATGATSPPFPHLESQLLNPLDALEEIFGQCRGDAIIGFGRWGTKKDGGKAPLAFSALRVDDRKHWLPAILEHQVEATDYVVPNTLDKAALVRGDYSDYLAAIRARKPLYFRKTNANIYEISAIFVDLDVGGDGFERSSTLPAPEAFGEVLKRCAYGVLPWPSMVAFSGRGVYLVYLLTGPDKHPPINNVDNCAIRKKILNKLFDLLQDLEPDSGATSISHWFKRPGTTDWRTGNEAVYMTGVGPNRETPRYSLQALADALQVPHAPMVLEAEEDPQASLPQTVPSPSPSRRPGGQRRGGNPTAPAANRVREIELLATHRGKIREGIREKTCFHYFHNRRAFWSMTLNAADPDPDDRARNRRRAMAKACEETREFNRLSCSPPLEPAELDGQVFRHLQSKRYIIHRATLAADLKVDVDEAKALELTSIVPRELVEESKRQHVEAQADRDRKKAEQAARRQQIEALLIEGTLRTRDIAVRAGVTAGRVSQIKGALRDAGRLPEEPQGSLIPEDV